MKIALKAALISKGAYYYQPHPEKDRRKKPLDVDLVARLKDLSDYELVYGYRKVSKKFKHINHKKIYRHMKALHMLQPRTLKKRRTTRLEISCAIGPNIRWENDLVLIWDGIRVNYLFVTIDTFDKEPIGDHYGLRCRADEAIISLEEAVKNRKEELSGYDLKDWDAAEQIGYQAG